MSRWWNLVGVELAVCTGFLKQTTTVCLLMSSSCHLSIFFLFVFVPPHEMPCRWVRRISVSYLQLREGQNLHPGLLQIWGHSLWCWWWQLSWGEGGRWWSWLFGGHHHVAADGCWDSRCVQTNWSVLGDKTDMTVFIQLKTMPNNHAVHFC